MDTKKATRSSRKKQRPQTTPDPFRKVVHFPPARGKTVEDVRFSTISDYHNISINFQDKTALNFCIETGFTLEADYSDWKTGDQRVLRVWPPVRSK